MMMVAVQTFALPAAPAQDPAPAEPEPAGNLPTGAAKAKRALTFYYTPYVPSVKYYYPTPTYYYYPYDIIV